LKYFIVPVLIVLIVFNTAIFGCTVFKVTKGKQTFFCNNEDGPDTHAVITFIPASSGKYGRFMMYFPKDPNPMIRTYPQGGMNDQGLVFDITATPLHKNRRLIFPEEAQRLKENLMEKVMSECATVEESIRLITRYKTPEMGMIQILIADKTGDSAVLGIDKDGRLAINRKADDFQVLTNFSLPDPENSVIYPCYRYEAATEMIQGMDEMSVDYLRSILSVVHVEGLASTVYSNIYDLNKGDIYFYYFHNFETPVKLNLEEELKKGERAIEMSTLFPRKVFAQIAIEELSKGVDKLRKELAECKKQK
jgi:hypothetical protein